LSFSIYRGVKFAIFHILREWILTQRSALSCIRVMGLRWRLRGVYMEPPLQSGFQLKIFQNPFIIWPK